MAACLVFSFVASLGVARDEGKWPAHVAGSLHFRAEPPRSSLLLLGAALVYAFHAETAFRDAVGRRICSPRRHARRAEFRSRPPLPARVASLLRMAMHCSAAQPARRAPTFSKMMSIFDGFRRHGTTGAGRA